jgi:50S ribosomal protein L16 3-hydroxylase
VAHWGVAEGPCFTYSIGFLAPSHGELVQAFLGYLGAARAAHADPNARYADPDLRPARAPLELDDAMVDRVAAVVAGVDWARPDVADFLGRYLTRPRPRAVFTPPRRPLPPEALAARLRRPGRLTLALPTRGLTRRGCLYVNGDAYQAARAALPPLTRLLAAGTLPLPFPARLDDRTLAIVHAWCTAGWASLGQQAPGRSVPT